jgi:hypothetical protein
MIWLLYGGALSLAVGTLALGNPLNSLVLAPTKDQRGVEEQDRADRLLYTTEQSRQNFLRDASGTTQRILTRLRSAPGAWSRRGPLHVAARPHQQSHAAGDARASSAEHRREGMPTDGPLGPLPSGPIEFDVVDA